MSIEDSQSEAITSIGKALIVLAHRGMRSEFEDMRSTAIAVNALFADAYEADDEDGDDNSDQLEGALDDLRDIAEHEDAVKHEWPTLSWDNPPDEVILEKLEELSGNALSLTFDQVVEQLRSILK